MSDWTQTTIGDLCERKIAELQTGPFGSQLHAYDYVDEGIPVVPTEAIRSRQIDHTVLPKITPSKAKELERHRLKVSDILFARRGVQATGHIGVVRSAEAGFICGTGAIRLRILPKNPIVSADFLSHVLANPASVAWFKFHAIGATMPNLNEGIIRSFPFGLPPLAQQDAITHLLSALDDKIDLNRRMNETLEAMARAIFQDWFVTFGPTRAKQEGRPPYLAPDFWSLFPNRLDGDGKPEGWATGTLEELIELNPPERLRQGTVAPYLDMAALPVRGAWPDPPIFREAGSGARFRNRDTLIARITPCLENGKTALVDCLADDEVAWGSTEFIVMRAKGSVPPEFGYLLARDEQFRAHAIQSMTGTSGRQRVQADALRGYGLALAPEAVVRAFGDAVSRLFRKITANARENETLAATRDLLLPKLMSGELRVNDAERILEPTA